MIDKIMDVLMIVSFASLATILIIYTINLIFMILFGIEIIPCCGRCR